VRQRSEATGCELRAPRRSARLRVALLALGSHGACEAYGPRAAAGGRIERL